MLSEQEIIGRINGVFHSLQDQSAKPAPAVSASTNIVQDLELDSVAVMDFVMAVETEFDIVISIETISEIRTVGELAGVISSLLAASPGDPALASAAQGLVRQ